MYITSIVKSLYLACENAFQLITIQIQLATTNYCTIYTYRCNVSELNKENSKLHTFMVCNVQSTHFISYDPGLNKK